MVDERIRGDPGRISDDLQRRSWMSRSDFSRTRNPLHNSISGPTEVGPTRITGRSIWPSTSSWIASQREGSRPEGQFGPRSIPSRPSTIDHRPSTIDHRPSTNRRAMPIVPEPSIHQSLPTPFDPEGGGSGGLRLRASRTSLSAESSLDSGDPPGGGAWPLPPAPPAPRAPGFDEPPPS
jgi:hypothetical protein